MNKSQIKVGDHCAYTSSKYRYESFQATEVEVIETNLQTAPGGGYWGRQPTVGTKIKFLSGTRAGTDKDTAIVANREIREPWDAYVAHKADRDAMTALRKVQQHDSAVAHYRDMLKVDAALRAAGKTPSPTSVRYSNAANMVEAGWPEPMTAEQAGVRSFSHSGTGYVISALTGLDSDLSHNDVMLLSQTVLDWRP